MEEVSPAYHKVNADQYDKSLRFNLGVPDMENFQRPLVDQDAMYISTEEEYDITNGKDVANYEECSIETGYEDTITDNVF